MYEWKLTEEVSQQKMLIWFEWLHSFRLALVAWEWLSERCSWQKSFAKNDLVLHGIHAMDVYLYVLELAVNSFNRKFQTKSFAKNDLVLHGRILRCPQAFKRTSLQALKIWQLKIRTYKKRFYKKILITELHIFACSGCK